MKILLLNASPRRKGNTEILLLEIVKGAGNINTETIRLYPKRIEPCTDCRKCKKEPFLCPARDDMQELYNKIDNSDIIIFGTPIYYYGPTAKMKLLLDRLRPYISNKKLAGKKGAIALPSEEGPGACHTTIEMFRMSFGYMGMEFLGTVFGTAYEKGEILNKKDELMKAREFGKQITGNIN